MSWLQIASDTDKLSGPDVVLVRFWNDSMVVIEEEKNSLIYWKYFTAPINSETQPKLLLNLLWRRLIPRDHGAIPS